ncbi:Enamine/imine deaminase [Anaerobiospirillum thomasii]|uniref:Enamine/imine deaminase n=1 Tax=Anaerobiospirillum thomasii TaxID=179995 RepID=A0A2X0V4S6_9GAMM|nr:RidA family protein [Anaerobiospirillum thomasii]SPT68933.1 Enamine/imine deaminase [Anaerobiospirillum thomasii]SPT71169.1 Enamine/imine deaminase [Anaerobiospirillum thomasii]
MSQVLSTDKAPQAIGPYSQGRIVGNLLFASGQVAINPKTGELKGDISEQTHQAMQNVVALVEAAGADVSKIVKTTCFLKNMSDFAVFNEIYASYLKAPYPARSCVAVAELPKGALCEIEVVVDLRK